MVTSEDIERFLIRLELPYEELRESMWLVGNGQEGVPPVVLNHTPPILLLRAEVMRTPDDEELRQGLFRSLLELNATDLVHGAYGLEGDDIVLTDALELADLDFSEVQASLDSILLALSAHYKVLAHYRTP
ncbi:MAG: YbjN domain-containing protein [Gemmatimonadota bacterium]|nr:YbjN domain-containing protein [Candidatus Palauibacterales bacterium]